MTAEIAALRQQVQDWGAASRRTDSATSEATALLLDCDLDADLADEIGRAVMERAREQNPRPLELRRRAAPPVPREVLLELLAEELAARLAVAPEPDPRENAWVAALVGPPGAGKTTTLVKLAVRYGLSARRPVQLICADACRIGAAHQLQAYAAIIGAGFQVVDMGRALRQAIEEHRGKSVVLIDTAGYSAGTMEDAWDLAESFASAAEIDIHLVLPATMKTADMARAIDRFARFHPRRLLFTNTDETGSLGGLYSAAVQSGLPLSFLGTGPAIPEHLEPAGRERLVERVLGPGARSAAAVA